MKCIEEPSAYPFKRRKKDGGLFECVHVRLIVLQLSDVKPTIYTRESFDTIHLFVWVLIQLRSTLCVWIARWWLIIPPIHSSPLSSLNSFSKKKKEGGTMFFVWRKSLASSALLLFYKKGKTHLSPPLSSCVFSIRFHTQKIIIKGAYANGFYKKWNTRLAVFLWLVTTTTTTKSFFCFPIFFTLCNLRPTWIWMRVAKTILMLLESFNGLNTKLIHDRSYITNSSGFCVVTIEFWWEIMKF